MEAVKPLLSEVGATLTLSDVPVMVGERHYLQIVAKLTCIETGDYIENTAVAMEPHEQKGMAPAQISGATSSYARKYCLNALFCIDDTKDADSEKSATKPRINKKQMQESVSAILAGLEEGDALGVKEVVHELTDDEQSFIWQQFDTAQKSAIKALIHSLTVTK